MKTVICVILTMLLLGCNESKTSGEPPVQVEAPSAAEFAEMAIETVASVTITDFQMDTTSISFSYDQVTDDSESVLLRRWLDMAIAAVGFMEAPQSITIFPEVQGTRVAAITIDAGDVAAFLAGERSLKEMLSRIEVGK